LARVAEVRGRPFAHGLKASAGTQVGPYGSPFL